MITRQGEKEYNSDFITVTEDGDCSFFAVADGHETPQAAELAVKTVAEDFQKSSGITKESIAEFFADADNALREDENPLNACMAFMMTDGQIAVWGNIGDCRIYWLRDNLLYEITPDHSGAYALYEAGEIRYPKIRRQKTRYDLTRMLGDGYDATPGLSQPEVIRKGDSFLICTDGFWSNIHELQIEKSLKKSSSAQEWLDKMVKIVDKNMHFKKYSRFKDGIGAITIKI